MDVHLLLSYCNFPVFNLMPKGEVALAQDSAILQHMESLMRDIQQVERNLNFELMPEKVILLLGETKAGKTTLMYYLLGKKLIRSYNEELGLYQMRPEAKIFDATIGNTYQSTTVYPNIPTELGEDKVLIIDMPGFGDTRDICRLLNIYIIRQVIKKINFVHVSLVISNETLQGEYLASIIKRNCLLLSSKLFATPAAISLIFTKIEDKTEDIESFRNALEEIKYDPEYQGITQALTVISNAKFYLFENKDPIVSQGEALKAQIVKENGFFQTGQRPENLLSESYADIISGELDVEFDHFVGELLEGVHNTTILLIRLLTAAVKLHHLPEFRLLDVYKDLEEERLREEVSSLAKKIHAGGISKLEVDFEGGSKGKESERLLSLVKKFYAPPHRDEVSLESPGVVGELKQLSEWSAQLEKQQSALSVDLRSCIHSVLSFCSKVLRTIGHIRQPKIISRFDAFCACPDLCQAIQAYRRIDSDCDLVTKVAQCEAGQELSEREDFMQMLRELRPELAFEGAQEIVENRKVSTWCKIKHKKMLESMQTTKDLITSPRKKEAISDISIEQISKQAISTLRSLPLDTARLNTVFSCAQKLRRQLENPSDTLTVEFGMVLFRKIAKMLQRVQLYEQAILFLLAIPAETEAAQLIRVGIDYCAISTEFIKEVLLKYYSEWSPSFTMVESLFNYVSLNIYDRQQLLANELELALLLEKMHEIDYQNLPMPQRFQYGLIEHIIEDGKNYQKHLLDQARRYQDRLSKSKVLALEKDILTMRLSN